MGCDQCREESRASKGPYFIRDGVRLCAECAGIDPEDVAPECPHCKGTGIITIRIPAGSYEGYCDCPHGEDAEELGVELDVDIDPTPYDYADAYRRGYRFK